MIGRRQQVARLDEGIVLIDVLDLDQPLEAIVEHHAEIRCDELARREYLPAILPGEQAVLSKAHDQRFEHCLGALPVHQQRVRERPFDGLSDMLAKGFPRVHRPQRQLLLRAKPGEHLEQVERLGRSRHGQASICWKSPGMAPRRAWSGEASPMGVVTPARRRPCRSERESGLAIRVHVSMAPRGISTAER